MEHNDIRPVEIKDLNKTQLILLAILLSFVVSIATGIVTVTLMQQASPAVNQTINRVVQHTIEKVVPDYTPGKTQTVVVKEDDLIVDAVLKVRSSIGTISDLNTNIADANYIGNGNFISSSYLLEINKTYNLSIGEIKSEVRVIYKSPFGFSILSALKPEILKNVSQIKLVSDVKGKSGQTLAIINSSSIIKSVVQSVVAKEDKDETGKVVKTWNVILVSDIIGQSMIGSLAVNIEGDVVGIVLPKGDMSTQIVGVNTITEAISDSAKNTAKSPLSAEVLPAIQ